MMRRSGFAGPEPLAIRELEDWARYFWPFKTRAALELFVAAMLALDDAFRDYMAQRAEVKREEAASARAKP